MYNQPDPRQTRYDSPGNSQDFDLDEPTAMDRAQDIAMDAKGIIKKHWKKAAIVLIALAVAFFLLDFFVLSIKQVSFTVADTEGARLSGGGIKIFDSAGNEIAKIGTGQPVMLRKGNYTATVTLSGYKQKTGVEVPVEGSAATIEVELEKDLDMELSVENFPQKLVEGQTTGVFVSIKNNRQKDETIDLAFDGALDSRYMAIKYPGPVLSPPGESRVFVELNLNDSINNSLIKDGLKGTIRIRGLNNQKAKKEVQFDLQAFDRKNLKLTGSAAFGRVTEGQTIGPKEITIENKLGFAVENIQFTVEIKGVQFSAPSEVEQWFSFDRDIPIPSLAAGDKAKVGLSVNVPIGIPFSGGATKETISGKLIASTSFWEEEIDVSLSAEKSDVQLAILGLNPTYSFSFDTKTGQFAPQSKIISLQNNGDLPITLINLSADCTTSGNWVAGGIITFDTTLFPQIAPNEEKKTTYTIKLPNAAGTNDTVRCTASANYNDPRGGSERLSTEFPFIINVR